MTGLHAANTAASPGSTRASRGRPAHALPATCDATRRTLSTALDRSLMDATASSSATAHLAQCADCRAWLATLQRGQQALATATPVHASASVRRAVLEGAHQQHTRRRMRRFIAAPTIGVVALVVLLLATGVFSTAPRHGGEDGGSRSAFGSSPDGSNGDITGATADVTPTANPITAIATTEASTAGGEGLNGDAWSPETCWSNLTLFTEQNDAQPDAAQIWFLLRFTDNACPKPSSAKLSLTDNLGEALSISNNNAILPMGGNPLGIIGHATWMNWCHTGDVVVSLELSGDSVATGQSMTVTPPACAEGAQAGGLMVDADPLASAWPLSGVGIGSMPACDMSMFQVAATAGPETDGAPVVITLDPNLEGDSTGKDPCLLPATPITVALVDGAGNLLDISGNGATATVGGVDALVIPGMTPLSWTWSNWCAEAPNTASAHITFGTQEVTVEVAAPGCVDATQLSTVAAGLALDPDAVEPPVTTGGDAGLECVATAGDAGEDVDASPTATPEPTEPGMLACPANDPTTQPDAPDAGVDVTPTVAPTPKP